MDTKPVPSLVLGTAISVHDERAARQGLILVKIADQTLRLRQNSRVVGYLADCERYLLGYVSDGYADTITLLIHKPTMMKVFRMQERQKNGSLPTREVWKGRKRKKKSETASLF